MNAELMTAVRNRRRVSGRSGFGALRPVVTGETLRVPAKRTEADR